MYRSVLAVTAGFIGGSIVIWILELLGNFAFPLPASIDPFDPDSIRRHMEEVPAAYFIMILVAYAAGSFSGGLVATAIAEKIRDAVIAGALLLVFNVIDLATVHHPVWFIVLSVVLFIPMAFLGGKVRLKKMKRTIKIS